MAGSYRSNVVQGTAGRTATFDPPLDALFVTAAPTADDGVFTINGVEVIMNRSALAVATLFNVGGISKIVGAASFTYIGLREKVSGAITDNTNVG